MTVTTCTPPPGRDYTRFLDADTQEELGILTPEVRARKTGHGALLPLPVDVGAAVADYLQRAARHIASKTDAKQAYEVGVAAVELALKGRNAVHSALYLWAKTSLPNYILSNLGDRMEMAHSIEGRLPFLDHELATFVSSLPDSYRVKGFRTKQILRRAALTPSSRTTGAGSTLLRDIVYVMVDPRIDFETREV